MVRFYIDKLGKKLIMLKGYFKERAKNSQQRHKEKIAELKQNQNLNMLQVWHNKLKKWHMFNFHKNSFSTLASVWILILLVGFGRIFGRLSSTIFYHIVHQHMTMYFTQYDSQGTLNVITMITTELLPILVAAWVWGNREWFENKWILHGWSKHPYLNKDAKLTLFKPFIIDIKVLSKDIWTHKMLIIISAICVTVIHTIATYLFTLLSGPNISSPYAIQLGQLLHENVFLYPMIIIVAPLFEESIFRVAVPNIFDWLFNKVRKGKFIETKYWLSAILSAMGYAALHEGTESNWGTLASFVVLSLLFQWLYKHSNSLSLPIAVHGISNFLVLVPNLFI